MQRIKHIFRRQRVHFRLTMSTNMADLHKILEQFHYFNIHADIDSVYGNWVVSSDGDVVNSVYPYAILSIHLKETDWLENMKTKLWFKAECEEHLR